MSDSELDQDPIFSSLAEPDPREKIHPCNPEDNWVFFNNKWEWWYYVLKYFPFSNPRPYKYVCFTYFFICVISI